MDLDVQQLIIALAGGGGITGLLVKGWQVLKEHNTDKLNREDSTIGKWQAIAEEREEQAHNMRWELNWYRRNYQELLMEYARLPPSDKRKFPTLPTPPAKTNTQGGNDE